MNDLDKFLKVLGKGPLLKGKITEDGNCFFHALEYALGNCPLSDKKHPLLNEDRLDAVRALRRIYQPESNRMHSKRLTNSNKRELGDLDHKLAELVELEDLTGPNYAFSTEEVIYMTSFLKQKILFILECEPIPERGTHQYGFTLILPKRIKSRDLVGWENLVILTRTGGNHYDTLKYPLDLPDRFVNTLREWSLDPDTLTIHALDRVMVKNGNVRLFLNEPSENELAARELQAMFNEANRNPEENRYFAEELQRQLQEEERQEERRKEERKKEERQKEERRKEERKKEERKKEEREQETIHGEYFAKKLQKEEEEQLQKQLNLEEESERLAKQLQAESVSRTHPLPSSKNKTRKLTPRTLSLNKGPTKTKKTLPTKTRKGYLDWFTRWMGPRKETKTRKGH